MRVVVTAQEICDAGEWSAYCELTGANYYAIKEGLMAMDQDVELDEAQARTLGFLPQMEVF